MVPTSQVGDSERWVASVLKARRQVGPRCPIDGEGIELLMDDGEVRRVLEEHVSEKANGHPWINTSMAHIELYLAYLYRRFRYFSSDNTWYTANFACELGDIPRFPCLGSELCDAMVEEALTLSASCVEASVKTLRRPLLVYGPDFVLYLFKEPQVRSFNHLTLNFPAL